VSTTQKIHVLYVITKLELGGAQKVCLSLLQGVDAQELTTSLISGSQGVLVPQAKEHHSVLLLKSFKREFGIKTLFLECAAFLSMIAHMRKLKKTVFHTRVSQHRRPHA